MTPVSTSSSRAGRGYLVRLAIAIAAYAVALAVAGLALRVLPDAGPWRYVVLALPLLPAAGVAVAVLRYLREADEMQRQIHLESLGAAFAAGSLITFGYGFMELAGAPPLSWLFVWPVYAACWLVASLLNRRRY